MEWVLIVEDDVRITRAFERLVGKLVRVAAASSAKDAKALFSSHVWAALIVDIGLPDGTGLDVLADARARGFAGPALVFSGHHDAEEINRAFALDAQYLVKPATGAVLRTFIEKAVEGTTRSQAIDRWADRYNLTAAEVSILREAVVGKTREEIAQRRRTVVATTKRQITTLLGKTGDRSLLAAVTRLMREGSW